MQNHLGINCTFKFLKIVIAIFCLSTNFLKYIFITTTKIPILWMEGERVSFQVIGSSSAAVCGP